MTHWSTDSQVEKGDKLGMEVGKRRVGARGSVVAGSVWESRMKSDEVRGGIKVFNAEENAEENGGGARLKKSPIGCGKRKTWKSESSEGSDNRISIQVARGKTETLKSSEELSISSSDGIKKSPTQTRKIASFANKLERSPIYPRRRRSETQKGGESDEGHERSSAQLRKSKSDPIKKIASPGVSSIQLRNTKSELDLVPDEPMDEKIEVENEKNDADYNNCMDLDDVCQEKVISSSSANAVQCSTELSVQVGNDLDEVAVDEADEGDEEGEEIEIEMEKRIDVKEISIAETLVVKEPEKDETVGKEQDKKVIVNEPEKKEVLNESEPKKIMKEPEPKKILNEPEPKRIVSAHMRFHHKNERKSVSVPLSLKQSPTIKRNSTINRNFAQANSIPKAEEYGSFPQTQSKLQSIVDLIMWRDISRSAFVFGIGTFIIVSSSYAKDINLRGFIEVENTNYVLGEEDAIWMLKLILPYLNEFLSKLKGLFSGDPGTTIKLAVLLFVLARCGSYITIWKMIKLGFFGVFTVPKICTSYSAQLTAYGNFWIRRFRDAWDSCTHKKAVALGIFGLVWNLSSVVARIWAVFVLFVAFRYYQQHYLVRDEFGEDEGGCDETWEEPLGVRHKQGHATNLSDTNKLKKVF
ncbi:reticulon-like protein B21 isoform X2 [Vigna radiata var. radiata]|uniref:Reticulon-like protein B21 isoform X2 n=1 Tax=Vigna radiata var. radiata TaxID=3916 RepID=A0A3Q0F0S6_VIGRR|nr:reticulon-like protein B21 isoform X2 [Vigna radiata var. radiata]